MSVSERSTSFNELHDDELVLLARAERSPDAIGELYRRHHSAAVTYARSLVRGNSFDADDLVAEAFVMTFEAIRRGGGPASTFRGYVFRVIRNARFRDQRANARLILAENPADLEHFAGGHTSAEQAVFDSLDSVQLWRAFLALPNHLQRLLWLTEIEHLTPAQLGPVLRSTPNNIAAMSYRARRRLTIAYLDQHARSDAPAECRTTIRNLAALVRSALPRGRVPRLLAHLAVCDSCRADERELREADRAMRR